MCAPPERYVRRRLDDLTLSASRRQQEAFRTIREIPGIRNGTLSHFRGTDVLMVYRADDFLSGRPDHADRGGIDINNDVIFGVRDDNAGLHRFPNRFELPLVFNGCRFMLAEFGVDSFELLPSLTKGGESCEMVGCSGSTSIPIIICDKVCFPVSLGVFMIVLLDFNRFDGRIPCRVNFIRR